MIAKRMVIMLLVLMGGVVRCSDCGSSSDSRSRMSSFSLEDQMGSLSNYPFALYLDRKDSDFEVDSLKDSVQNLHDSEIAPFDCSACAIDTLSSVKLNALKNDPVDVCLNGVKERLLTAKIAFEVPEKSTSNCEDDCFLLSVLSPVEREFFAFEQLVDLKKACPTPSEAECENQEKKSPNPSYAVSPQSEIAEEDLKKLSSCGSPVSDASGPYNVPVEGSFKKIKRDVENVSALSKHRRSISSIKLLDWIAINGDDEDEKTLQSQHPVVSDWVREASI